VIITEDKPEYKAEYQKACTDLMSYYKSWKIGFTYANPEEQAVHLVMETFKLHQKDKNYPLITFGQAKKEQLRRKKEKDIKRGAQILLSKYPALGPIAEQVIRYEAESDIWLRFQENDLARLVHIIKLTEGKNEYLSVYYSSINELRKKYSEWAKTEQGYMNQEKEIVIEMIDRLNKHFADPTLQISTYAEIKKEIDNEKIANKGMTM
jgi:hypothetical protein